jgi:hypothetical protein
MNEPIFTKEELDYIEKNMDLSASYFEKYTRQNVENVLMAQISGLIQDEDKKKMLMKITLTNLEELFRASEITNSIRKKIEEYKKNVAS